MEYKTSVQCRSVNTQNITDIKKEIRKRNMLKSKLVSTLSWSPTFGRGSIIMWRVNFYCYSVMSYRLACVASVSNRVILFLLSSQLSRRTRAERHATQATYRLAIQFNKHTLKINAILADKRTQRASFTCIKNSPSLRLGVA